MEKYISANNITWGILFIASSAISLLAIIDYSFLFVKNYNKTEYMKHPQIIYLFEMFIYLACLLVFQMINPILILSDHKIENLSFFCQIMGFGKTFGVLGYNLTLIFFQIHIYIF